MHRIRRKGGYFIWFFLFVSFLFADEGLWLFNKVPVELIKTRYGFTVSNEWINHFQLSCVKMGGSASFVSPDGLVVTNHHVGAGAIDRLGTKDRDLMKTGFYAKTKEEELKCPGLEVVVLVGIEDVTQHILEAAKSGKSPEESSRAMGQMIQKIQKEQSEETGLRCEIVKLYSGGMYHLYKYKVHKDVRLVFAPEQQMAFFGGDPDNYGFPRFCLDVSFFRVYEDGKPYHSEHYLKWSTRDLKDGELVFAAGNPMITSRLLTVSQLEFLRDVSYPFMVQGFKEDIEFYSGYSQKGTEEARQVFTRLWGSQNSLKCIQGQLSGLTDPVLMQTKIQNEKEIIESLKQNPELAKIYLPAWKNMAQAQKAHAEIYIPYQLFIYGEGFQTTYYRIARGIVNYVSKGRDDFYRNWILSQKPLDDESEISRLTKSLARLQENAGQVREAKWLFGGRSPEEVARELITQTKLRDQKVIEEYLDGDSTKTCLSPDPMIKLAYLMQPLTKGFSKRYQKEVTALENQAGTLIARALFELKGTSFPPDASSTLRLSFGAVRGYIEDDGPRIPHQTTFKGLFERSERNGNQFPYNLPESFLKAKSKIDLDRPLNFVATCDASGGNSGSPLVNTDCEFIGILFDGNKQSLPSRFLYDDKQARSVMVHGLGILEALKSVYEAKPLVEELIGPK